MASVKIQRVENPEDRSLAALQRIDAIYQDIRRRAFELYAERGFAEGYDFEDWMTAERESCSPAAELAERDRDYVLCVALPGFEPAQISVTATPKELVVHASAKSEAGAREQSAKQEPKVLWSEFESEDVYRCVELTDPIDVTKVSANLSNGLLRIVAEKSAKSAVSIPIAAAA
jgi:HSP20 family molecular chaperone IbpA